MLATLPLIQKASAAPSDQLASVVVFQLPLPSLGTVGLTGLASQVTVAAGARSAYSVVIAASGKAKRAREFIRRRRAAAVELAVPNDPSRPTFFSLRMSHSPLRLP